MTSTDTIMKSEPNRIISAILTYLGGLFLFLGLNTCYALYWFDLNNTSRLLLTLGMGTVAYITALFLFNRKNIYHLAVVLYFISTIQLIIGLFVLFYLLGFMDLTNFNQESNIVQSYLNVLKMNNIAIFSIITTQQIITYYYIKPIEPIAIALLLSFIALISNIFNYFNLNGEYIAIFNGILYLCLVYLFANTVFKKSSPVWNFIGSISLLIGFYFALSSLNASILLFLVMAIILTLSLIERSLTLLYISIFAAIIHLFNLTSDYFANLIGWPFTIILFGISFIIISFIVNKISNKKTHACVTC